MDLDRILKKPFSGEFLAEDEAAALLSLPPGGRAPVYAAADRLNREINGRRVSYVFNRNINFTNACTGTCGFCAYRVEPDDAAAYVLAPAEAVELAGRTPGIDEVCMVGGLNPAVTLDDVLAIFAAIHEAHPHIHIHALSPMEVEWYSRRSRLTVRETFEKLLAAGYGSLCGTAAEILVDEVRREICPSKLSTARWVEIVRTAHEMGIRSTSTILFGHIERLVHVARHLGVLREIQQATGGITEFIPLPFVPYRTPLGQAHGIHEMISKEDVFVFRAALAEPSDLVGETGAGRGGREFRLRRQRPWRHADGREHHPHGGRAARPGAWAGRDGRGHPRGGVHTRAERYAVSFSGRNCPDTIA
ncbi:MAG: radical SAM protein [Planctomycetota bacterium]|nr:radical SAM protein [Planctomycetota bacterium]